MDQNCPFDTAVAITASAIEEARTTLFPFTIPLYTETKQAEKTVPGARTRPYLATCYDFHTLENLNILAYLPEILEDRNLLDPDEFKNRVRSGFKEETIHALHVLSDRIKFQKLKNHNYRDAEDYHNKRQHQLFVELGTTHEGRKILVASGKLYYADLKLDTPIAVLKEDIESHARPGYITLELTRQIMQIRLGELVSEQALSRAWDKFGRCGFNAHKEQLNDLVSTIKTHAPNPAALSPMMGEIIKDIEDLILENPFKQKDRTQPNYAVVSQFENIPS